MEKQAAKKVDGRAVANSGATPWAKEDVKNDVFLFQHKDCTHQKSHGIKFEAFEELRRNAIDEGLEAAYWIEGKHRSYFVISEELFNSLNDALKMGGI